MAARAEHRNSGLRGIARNKSEKIAYTKKLLEQQLAKRKDVTK